MRILKDYTFTSILSNLSRSQMLCFEMHFHCFQKKWLRLVLSVYFILVQEVLWNNHKIFPLGFTQVASTYNISIDMKEGNCGIQFPI